ncbi:acyl-CoA dehydrogenase NM domain-like protein [Exidia glandulosa HHB12029]|uniref:Acyl-CoA dehydrogenase NM domain-like protein n=1 Tax=Exidia glandulosa HHB12029 TaxID=1314781 RepID=A0A165BAZ7_EXIGL|nr:acyl-CoA dehydrogenase NM domain-like protein [Exidia glandulosa HHB12029]
MHYRSITRSLATSPLFQQITQTLRLEERLKLSYERAQAVCRAYGLVREDVLYLSQNFWDLHTDPIWTMDGAACTLATIQANLCAGTLANFSTGREDVTEVLKEVLRFDISGQFCLTELGHGLDVINLETTATLLDNGDFDLHSPTDLAAKYMPPTTPVHHACVCVVFARLIVRGEDYGIKPFMMRIHDGTNMCPGVTSTLLPPRGGSRPLNHALTSFNHVILPPTALLGPLEKPENPRDAFFSAIQRVVVGTIALPFLSVPVLQVASVIAARYSIRRRVTNHQTGVQQPIIAFQSQKTPILTAIAQVRVLEAFMPWATKASMRAKDPRVRQAIATITKLLMVSMVKESLPTLSERCGAQGLFEVNQMSALEADARGIAIAEGDNIAISIRLASELLLGRYAVPEAADPTTLLARCEAAMFADLRALVATMDNHRSETYNQYILPESVPLVRAIGMRMAYDAAIAAGVDPALVAQFEASGVRANSAVFVELGVPLREQRKMLVETVAAVFPQLQALLDEMDVDAYITAPIVSAEMWSAHVASLRSWTSSSVTGTCSSEQLLGKTVAMV